MSFPFYFSDEEQDSALYKKMRFTWTIVEHEAETSGLDVVMLTTKSVHYVARRLPYYDPETKILVVDSCSRAVTLRQMVEGLGLHAARAYYRPGDMASVSRWRAEAERCSEELRVQMEAFVVGMAEPDKAKQPPKGTKKAKVGRGNWDRPDVHPLHCQALKSDWTPCQAMRVKGTAFCYQHQWWLSNLNTLDDILGELKGGGWHRTIGSSDSAESPPA